MKVIVFGSTGSVGKQVVIQALSLGHKVTAFTRNTNNGLVEIDHNDLHFFQGDVLDRVSVKEAIEGHDAVICVLGGGRKGNIRAQGTRNIIDAMEELSIKRFLCLSTLGAGDSRASLNFWWKNIMFGWLLKEAYLDHQLQEEFVINSDLDWVLVRPGAFTNGPATGKFKHGFPPTEKSIKVKISRADVAMFLLMQLESDQYLRRTPALSY